VAVAVELEAAVVLAELAVELDVLPAAVSGR
jgi:hypothetical protein